MKKKFYLLMNKNSKKRKKIKIKFLSGRGSKSLPLTVFLVEKTEPNYETANDIRLLNYNASLCYVDSNMTPDVIAEFKKVSLRPLSRTLCCIKHPMLHYISCAAIRSICSFYWRWVEPICLCVLDNIIW